MSWFGRRAAAAAGASGTPAGRTAPGSGGGTPLSGGSAAEPFGGVNAKVAAKQRMYLVVVLFVILAADVAYIMSREDKKVKVQPDDAVEVKISTDDMVGKKLAQKEWVARSENQMSDQSTRLKAVEARVPDLQKVSTDLASLQQENAKLKADGARLFQIYEQQNASQAAQLEALKKGGPAARAGGSSRSRWQQPVSEPFRVAGAGAGGPGGPGGPGAGVLPAVAEVKAISFAPVAAPGGAGRSENSKGFVGALPDAPPTVIEASPDYLPPNSYAPARVIVGVDASAGVSSQTDPLPVVLRIGASARADVNDTAMPEVSVRSIDEINQTRGERGGLIDMGERHVGGRIDRREEAFEGPRSHLSPNPQETLDNVIGKDERGLRETLVDGVKSIFEADGRKKP